jgi:hypothetical protein
LGDFRSEESSKDVYLDFKYFKHRDASGFLHRKQTNRFRVRDFKKQQAFFFPSRST